MALKFKNSVLISTYNWPEALKLVLKSLEVQTLKPDEILIADDGSKAETKQLIDTFKKTSNLNIVHVWHEDNGFRKSEILNKAIAQATGDYIIQADGDCILHKDFVKDHVQEAKKNQFLYGSRVNIQEGYLPTLFKDEVIHFNAFSKGIKKRTRSLRIPLFSKLYLPKDTFAKKFRGCNTSYWRDDFIKVNGYNEAITGWGREDSEMIIRVLNSGVSGRRLRYKGIVFHIWHKSSSKANLEKNHTIQQQTLDNKSTWCEQGIDKYL